jgi:hypothetical protein
MKFAIEVLEARKSHCENMISNWKSKGNDGMVLKNERMIESLNQALEILNEHPGEARSVIGNENTQEKCGYPYDGYRPPCYMNKQMKCEDCKFIQTEH